MELISQMLNWNLTDGNRSWHKNLSVNNWKPEHDTHWQMCELKPDVDNSQDTQSTLHSIACIHKLNNNC